MADEDQTTFYDEQGEPADLRAEAVKRIKAKRGFWTHLFIYCAINLMLVAIWAMSSDRGFFWPVFVLIGWGIGVATNAWAVFGTKPITEADITGEMERLKGG